MSHPFVETKEMTVGYRGVPLIRDIALRVHRGEILTLIGPNGSGKSTILKSLIRQLALIGGTVYLDGKSLQTLPERDLARTMSVLLTEHVRPELMTCWDVAAAGRYPYTGRLGLLSDEDRAKVDEAQALVRQCGNAVCCLDLFGPVNEKNRVLRDWAQQEGLLRSKSELENIT